MSNHPLILVTGGAGYIGSHTIIELLASGFDVVSADNYSNSSAQTYQRIKQITGASILHEEVDLNHYENCKRLFEKHPRISGIIHFAAFKSVPESVANPYAYYSNNLGTLLHLLKCAELFRIPHFIFSSSCSVYGNIQSLPVSEQTPLGTVESPYAATKLMGESILRDCVAASEHLRGIALRYFNPAGAHATALNGELPINAPNNLVPVITRTAMGLIPSFTVFGSDYDTRDGTCIRDYIHVCDIARAHVMALQALQENKISTRFDFFNLGSGNGVTVLEAIQSFEKMSGIKPNYVLGKRRAGDVMAIYSDSTKAAEVLNWKPIHSLDEMMDSAWKWELQLAKERS
ncbi:MAG: UDP-glucose 4-epimerase GalE [Bacteroidia bacterium]